MQKTGSWKCGGRATLVAPTMLTAAAKTRNIGSEHAIARRGMPTRSG